MASGLTEVYKRVGPDIIRVLSTAKKPLSQQTIYNERDTKISMHINAWSYTLDYLEKLNLVEFVGPYHWKIKGRVYPNDISLDYLLEVRDYVCTKSPL